LPYDLKGDGYQNGGTMIITKGGEKVLLDYRQENAADHVDPDEILKALGISPDELASNKKM
jgi:prostamide/prostaglandin F2alpha synthase